MTWQLYWPAWYKLWPHYRREIWADYGSESLINLYINWFCFGPFQCHWYSSEKKK